MSNQLPSDNAPSLVRSVGHALIIIAVLMQSLFFVEVCLQDLFNVSALEVADDVIATLIHGTRTARHTACMTLEFHPAGVYPDPDSAR